MGEDPTSQITAGTLFPVADDPYRDSVIGILLRPWRTSRTWWSLVHSVLDVPVGIVTFIPAVVLLSTSVGLLITFPIAIPFIILLFLFARLVGRVERHRLAALHGTQLADPIPPTTPGPMYVGSRSPMGSVMPCASAPVAAVNKLASSRKVRVRFIGAIGGACRAGQLPMA